MRNYCVLCQEAIVPQLTMLQILGISKVQNSSMCCRCRQEFYFIGDKCCQVCGKMDMQPICSDCEKWQQQGYNDYKHQALCVYNESMHDYFKRYKRYGDFSLRKAFQMDLRKMLVDYPEPFIFIPSSQEHLQQRQFDPTVGLFGDLINLTPAFIKMPTKVAQAQKNRQQRLATPQFLQFDHQYNALLTAKQITIVDDIYTTGRTILHAYDCLRAAGFTGVIRSCSLAR
ncbi:ComF family protein [Bombilactobacillus thymidiniphilus]|uniref:ComF family protein n=1 Tax=Bombilactobacillus thymidiniphilus TaxID=2923363 RepID=A0ABY4PC85_9LACO|nr:ComF family protein [Bombilactobacillus thymidiniphilus]UQS83306.1 ComF family protein [Bombilactobacillus thymidiniphilus]